MYPLSFNYSNPNLCLSTFAIHPKPAKQSIAFIITMESYSKSVTLGLRIGVWTNMGYKKMQ